MATGLARFIYRSIDLLNVEKGKVVLSVFKRCYSPPSNKGQADLFPRRLVLQDHGYVPTLSPNQIASILTLHETRMESRVEGHHEIKAYMSNQLSSNHPVEDRRSQARLLETNGVLFGIFDGHAGPACAQSVSERLFDYIAVSLLPHNRLEEYSHALKTDSPMDLLVWHYNVNDYRTDEFSTLYRNSLQRYVVETLSMSGLEEEEGDSHHTRVKVALRNAFLRLDADISNEAQPIGGALDVEALEVAMSGSCACVAHIDGTDVYVANVGDCRAVLGQLDENGDWMAVPLSVDHNFDNKTEVERIRNTHPSSESSFVLKNNRLLGQLIPLRAFGDVRYKWSLPQLRNVVNILDNAYAQTMMPMNYYTPPYLIAEPEIIHHKLELKDKFLVLATDGLWEMLTDDKVVRLVGEHLEGKQTVDHFMPGTGMKLGDINEELMRRQFGLAHKSTDTNVATHLIRNALGPENRQVSEMLTLPHEVVRYYRDDITVTVIYFDSDNIARQ